MSDKDVDAQFADIIAHWDDVAELPDEPQAVGPDPVEASPSNPSNPSPANPSPANPSPANPSPANPAAPGSNPSDTGRGAVNPPLDASWPVWRGAEAGAREDEHAESVAAADDDEHFEPGPTAPLPPQEDLQFWGIVLGLVGGPLLLLWLVLFRRDVSDWWTLLALALTAGGFVLLVMRQPHSRNDDDPDNGARV